MGCAQSTVKDQVQDTAAPAADVAAPEAVAAVVEETTEAAAAVETPAEGEVAAVVVDETSVAPVEEAAATEEAAPVAEAEPEAAVAETADASTAEEEVVAAAAVEEEKEAVDAPTATEEEAAPAEQEAAEETPAEPETEATPVADETKESGLVFTSTGVSFGDKGVAYYSFTGSNAEDPAQDVKISKRFNDFKALHAEVAVIMANEANVAPEHQDKFKTYPALPALPKTSLFRGRTNAKQTEEREAQFLKILNAIARHPIAAESAKFKAFLA